MIPAFRVDFTESEKDLAMRYFEDVLDSGYLTLGKYTKQFETAFTKISQTTRASCVSTGTVALEIILRALEVKGSVLVPTNTNYATVAAVISAGLTPILYDGDIYPSVEAITKHTTKDVGTLIIVHIGGYISPDIEEIQRFCKHNNIYLIEDAAHAHGANSDVGAAGSLGVAAAFSFFPTKVMSTGEGGMVTTSNSQLHDTVNVYRDQGKDASGNHNIVSGNSWRMSELHAGLGYAQIPSFHDKLTRRRAILLRYEANLQSNPHVRLAGGDFDRASGHKCILLTETKADRDALRTYLNKHDIGTSKGVYEIPIHQQPVFAYLKQEAYPLAEDFADRHLCLPIWSAMTLEQVDTVTAAIDEFFSTYSNHGGVATNAVAA